MIWGSRRNACLLIPLQTSRSCLRQMASDAYEAFIEQRLALRITDQSVKSCPGTSGSAVLFANYCL